MRKLLIVGCGDIGRRVARLAQAQGDSVTALVRTLASRDELHKMGIDVIQADLDDPMEPLDVDGQWILYLAPPPAKGREDPRMRHLLQALRGTPRRLLYLSTTGVYGDCQGEWVDETHAVAPAAERAMRRLHAERQLSDCCSEKGWSFVIMRVAGIYGRSRLPLQRLRERQPVLRVEQAPYTNRIHEDDLARIALGLLDKGVDGEIYNVTDGHPGTMSDYFKMVARYAGLPQPPEIDMHEASRSLTAGMVSYLQESRRISNRKMMDLLGIKLRYATLEDGLREIFASHSED
jgi:nucleoside-diphosphate-sugar epimerase